MAEKKETAKTEIKTIQPKPKSKSKKKAPPAPVDNRPVCVVCGRRINKVFATAGNGEPICSPVCVARLGRISGK